MPALQNKEPLIRNGFHKILYRSSLSWLSGGWPVCPPLRSWRLLLTPRVMFQLGTKVSVLKLRLQLGARLGTRSGRNVTTVYSIVSPISAMQSAVRQVVEVVRRVAVWTGG